MPRARLRDFSKGIWSVGPKDTSPSGTFRRLKGTHALKTASIRSRDGSTRLFDLLAHSLFKFNGHRYSGVGASVYEDNSVVNTGLTGERLAFVPAPALPTGRDCLFIAGGGALIKKNPVSGNVEPWGIDPPIDGFSATPIDKAGVQIDGFDDHTTWTVVNATDTDEATIKQEGSKALKLDIATVKQAKITKAIVVDLETNIPDEAHIELWVRIDFPARVSSIQVLFDVSAAADFTTDYYSLSVIREDQTIPADQIQSVFRARGGTSGFSAFSDAVLAGQNSQIAKLIDIASIQSITGQTAYPSAVDTWTKLRLPKSLFHRSGTSATTWKNVSAVRIIITTNAGGAALVYLDDLRIAGINSLVGDYKYLITYANSTTGARSNANPTPVLVSNVDRQSVNIANLPTSLDSQVDTIELWRTLGGGTTYFKAASFPVATSTYNDDAADFPGINSIATESANFIDNEILPTDNAPPAPTYNDAFGPYNGVMFWTRDSAPGGEGRLYYSPVGRPESVVGFINVSTSDDPTMKGVIWNRVPWVLTREGIVEVVGQDPFVPRAVEGAPGTTNPFTVVVTPSGIIYEAEDGIRIFDGNASRLIGFNELSTLFRGENVENIAAFTGLVATFARGEYLISNGTTTLALNVADETWREPGIPATALHFESDTKRILASFDGKLYAYEDEGVSDDDGAPFPFEVEVPSFYVDADKEGVVQRIIVEANTRGVSLTPTLILDDAEIVLPAFSTTVRRPIEWAIGRKAHVAGIRFSGNVVRGVEIQSIEMDVYVPEATQVV